ncbi:MAG TPA: cysteine--tRNA ligase, partial [candidate division CPR3 bacterium]|nr:cysteine--tRNA ligase [candidate division CPR3 bacterium]
MSRLKLFNTEIGKKKVFTSTNNKVGIYICGITPYDVTHLGHAFLYTSFDVLVRYLRYLGYSVTYVQNITDIDDEILKKAKELKKNWRVLGEENAQGFFEDQRWLNNISPDHMPRAT